MISRDLVGKIVDDVFGGAIEDASVIGEIYDAFKRHEVGGWNFDINTAPRGRNVSVMRNAKNKDGVVRVAVKEFEPDYLWLASSCGKVIKSSWVPANGRHNGYWSGFAQNGGTPPVAWQPFVVPVHPYQESDSGAFAAVKGKARLADHTKVEPSLSDRQYLEKITDQVIARNQPKAETSREASPAAETESVQRGAGVVSVCPALIDDVGGGA